MRVQPEPLLVCDVCSDGASSVQSRPIMIRKARTDNASNRRASFVLVTALFLGLAACAESATDPGGTGEATNVRFLLNRPADLQHSPWYMAEEQGFFAEENLDVGIQPAPADGSSVTTLTAVASGEMDIGIADVTSMMLALEQDPDLPVTIIFQHETGSRFAVMSLKSGANVDEPEDLKEVPVYTLLSASVDEILQAWAFEQGLGKLTFKDVNTTAYAQFLLAGRIPTAVSTVEGEFALRELAAKEGEELVMFAPREFGLDEIYGGVMVVNDDFAAEHPDAVEGFVAATLRGFEFTADNMDAVIEFMHAKFPIIAEEIEPLARLQLRIDLATDEGRVDIGVIDPAAMAKTVEFLQGGLDLEQEIAPEDIFTTEFFPAGS